MHVALLCCSFDLACFFLPSFFISNDSYGRVGHLTFFSFYFLASVLYIYAYVFPCTREYSTLYNYREFSLIKGFYGRFTLYLNYICM